MTDTPTLALGGTLICLAGCILGRVTSPGPGGVPSDSARRRIKEKLSKSCTSKADVKGGEMGELDVRRMCQIAVGGPTDHAGEVVIMRESRGGHGGTVETPAIDVTGGDFWGMSSFFSFFFFILLLLFVLFVLSVHC